MAEEVKAGSLKYHKRCFTCNNKPSCNKSLDSGSYNDHNGTCLPSLNDVLLSVQ